MPPRQSSNRWVTAGVCLTLPVAVLELREGHTAAGLIPFMLTLLMLCFPTVFPVLVLWSMLRSFGIVLISLFTTGWETSVELWPVFDAVPGSSQVIFGWVCISLNALAWILMLIGASQSRTCAPKICALSPDATPPKQTKPTQTSYPAQQPQPQTSYPQQPQQQPPSHTVYISSNQVYQSAPLHPPFMLGNSIPIEVAKLTPAGSTRPQQILVAGPVPQGGGHAGALRPTGAIYVGPPEDLSKGKFTHSGYPPSAYQTLPVVTTPPTKPAPNPY